MTKRVFSMTRFTNMTRQVSIADKVFFAIQNLENLKIQKIQEIQK